MAIKTITFNNKISVQIQINNIKKMLIEANVLLGKKFSFEIATLILQIEKLINYYDTKKLPARFKAQFQSLELTLSNQEIYFNDSLNRSSSIKTDFYSAKTNDKKKHIIFELLFFHLDILFNAYQTQELTLNSITPDNSYQKQGLITVNSAKQMKNKSPVNSELKKLILKQHI